MSPKKRLTKSGTLHRECLTLHFSEEASYKFDEQKHKDLVSQADVRNAQRLRRCAQPHASCFVTAVPSDEDGKDTIMRPRNFRMAVRYRLGVNVLKEEIPCPLCKQTITVSGDHATCCAKSGDLITRHNSLRNLLDNLASVEVFLPFSRKRASLVIPLVVPW